MSAAHATDTSTALVIAAESAGWDDAKIAIIKEHVAPGIDDGNLAFFAATCARTGLDPVLKQIYIIGRNQKDERGNWGKRWTIQVGIDGLQQIAARSRQWAGVDLPQFGPMVEAVKGGDPAHPEWAAVTVYRLVHGQRMPFSAICYWDEYAQRGKDEKLTGRWADMPRNQLAKCARSAAIRMGFPAETSQLYTDDEMGQADNPRPVSAPPLRVVEQDAPRPARPATESVLSGMRDEQVSLQKLYDRFKQTGTAMGEWTAAKRKHNGDLVQLEQYVAGLERSKVQADDGELTDAEIDGLFGTGPLA